MTKTLSILRGRMLLTANARTLARLLVWLDLSIRIRGSLPNLLNVCPAMVSLCLRTILKLIDRVHPTVVRSVTVLVVPMAFVLNPRGSLVHPVSLWAMDLTTLLLERNGGTPPNSPPPLHNILTFTGLKTPRLENVKKLVLRLRIPIDTRGASRVLLIMTTVPPLRVTVVTLPIGPICLSMPETRATVMTPAPLATRLPIRLRLIDLLGWYLTNWSIVFARCVITRYGRRPSRRLTTEMRTLLLVPIPPKLQSHVIRPTSLAAPSAKTTLCVDPVLTKLCMFPSVPLHSLAVLISSGQPLCSGPVPRPRQKLCLVLTIYRGCREAVVPLTQTYLSLLIAPLLTLDSSGKLP